MRPIGVRATSFATGFSQGFGRGYQGPGEERFIAHPTGRCFAWQR
jgi:hypothetical protein